MEDSIVIPVELPVIQPNSFINGDCMDFMRTCPPNFFDLAIVDPPYGIGEDGKGVSRHKGGQVFTYFEKKNWDASPPDKEYFEQLFRVSKNQIIWGANYFVKHLPVSMGWIFWDKRIGGDFSDGELAFTSFNRALKMVRKSIERNRATNAKSAEKWKRIHPCQKPVEVYKWILNKYAKAGDLILDTHVGSASSLIACVELGYDYVGFEIDRDYWLMASKRLSKATRKYELFEIDKE